MGEDEIDAYRNDREHGDNGGNDHGALKNTGHARQRVKKAGVPARRLPRCRSHELRTRFLFSSACAGPELLLAMPLPASQADAQKSYSAGLRGLDLLLSSR